MSAPEPRWLPRPRPWVLGCGYVHRPVRKCYIYLFSLPCARQAGGGERGACNGGAVQTPHQMMAHSIWWATGSLVRIVVSNGFLTEILLLALWLVPPCLQPTTFPTHRPCVHPVALVSTVPPVTVLLKMYHQGQIHRPTKAVRSTRHTLVGHGSAGRPLPAWKPNVRNQVQSARLAQLPQSAQVYNNVANGASHKTNTSEPGSKVYIQELPKV